MHWASELALVCLGLSQQRSISSLFVTSWPERSARKASTLRGCGRSIKRLSSLSSTPSKLSSVKPSKRNAPIAAFIPHAELPGTIAFSESVQQSSRLYCCPMSAGRLANEQGAERFWRRCACYFCRLENGAGAADTGGPHCKHAVLCSKPSLGPCRSTSAEPEQRLYAQHVRAAGPAA